MVNDSRYSVFAANANYTGYKLEHDGNVSTSFTLYDANTVKRLVKDDPDLLPPKKAVGKDKSYQWYNRQITNAVTQGILQGESVPEMARRIGRQTGESNMTAMLRNARTMFNGAQNAGRIEGLHQAQELGIKVKKQWMATLDDRTRDTHADLDGQIRDVDEPFDSELGPIMYPGDPEADPANVWNCRCTLVYVYPEYPGDMERRDNETGENVGDMTYREWEASKALTAAAGHSIMSDSRKIWHAITAESIAAVPEFTEFDSPEMNQAVRDACVDILTDMQTHEVGTEKAISIPLSGAKPRMNIGGEGEGAVQIVMLGEPYIAVHNHASNETLSFEDADYFGMHPNCVGIVAVGNNGHNAYSLIKGNTYDNYGFANYRALRMTGLVDYESEEDFLRGVGEYGIRYTSRTD